MINENDHYIKKSRYCKMKPPMIVNSLDHLFPIYIELNTYQHLMDDHLFGNTDDDDMILLHEKAGIYYNLILRKGT